MRTHYGQAARPALFFAERPCPTRAALAFQGKAGQVALEQLRAVDRQRLVRQLGSVSNKTAETVSARLVEMFVRQEHWRLCRRSR